MHKLKTLIPMHELEQEAQQQIYNELARPFLKKLAIMPDCHAGYTLPIGGVALLDGVISPEYVGYDQGCGMICLILQDVMASDIHNDRLKIFDEIYTKLPVGFNCHSEPIDYHKFCSASGNSELNQKVNNKLYIQLATLGSGNHFVEIGETTNKKLAITIHSGSRNIGHSIAGYYMKLSQKVDAELPAGFLHLESEHGQAFLKDLNFALQYALDNRLGMLRIILSILKIKHDLNGLINENHNHAIVTPDGVLHRKGATPADKGQLGVIPGNMKSGVYVTSGLGNIEYLSSASHGAGRKMSRKKAKKNIDMEGFRKSMKGIVAKVTVGTLDESPQAYKNIDKIINAQRGVVIDVVDYIKPLINIKG